MEYPALFEPSKEGGFVVTFPDFDWGVTQGETEQDAREMALDALCMMIRQTRAQLGRRPRRTSARTPTLQPERSPHHPYDTCAPRVPTYTEYSDWLAAMYSRFRLGPPKHRLAQISGSRIMPMRCPCGENTCTPS
jgi:predicted RNase H-like HicB family nuclease